MCEEPTVELLDVLRRISAARGIMRRCVSPLAGEPLVCWWSSEDQRVLDERTYRFMLLAEREVAVWRSRGRSIADIHSMVIPELIDVFRDALIADQEYHESFALPLEQAAAIPPTE